ncbi:MAG: dihydrolipoamide acetyltransferase family protein [Rhodothermaceae bacterium]
MRYIFKFPDIGEGLEEGTINQWYVKKGQEVEVGDPLCNMETDKVATDIPSPKAGVIVALFGKEGETINVGDPLVEIELEGEAGAETAEEQTKVEPIDEGEGAGVVGTLEVAGNDAYLPASDEGNSETEIKQTKPERKSLATPVARAYAKELGIDINQVKGSGPAGRVMKKDILEFSQNKTSPAVSSPAKQQEVQKQLVDVEPLSQIRKTIAKNMIESKHNAAHMTIFDETEISELVALRARFKDRFAERGTKLSYMPFILKAVALALKKFRSLNAQMDIANNQMLYKNYYNIGIAVDTEYGLVVPVIRDVDKLSIFELAEKVNELAVKARDRGLTMEDMSDGTFTITNYGAIGGMFGVPIINYPQTGILGIGRLLKKPVVKNDEIVVGSVLPLSLSVDHRIVDGGDTARFVNQVMEYLSDPATLIME